MRTRWIPLLLTLAACDAVFGTPYAHDAGATDDAVDAPDSAKCRGSADKEERLCLTFDDGDVENARDGSGYGNHASYAAVVIATRKMPNDALQTDTSSSITIPVEQPLSLEVPGPMTFAMWLRFDPPSQPPPIMTAFDNHGQYAINLRNVNAWNATLSCNVTTSPATNPVTALINAQTWVHVACIKDAAELRMYLNGSLVQPPSTSTAGVETNVGEPVRIGQNAEPGGMAIDPLIGAVDEVRVYAKALTSDEVGILARQ